MLHHLHSSLEQERSISPKSAALCHGADVGYDLQYPVVISTDAAAAVAQYLLHARVKYNSSNNNSNILYKV